MISSQTSDKLERNAVETKHEIESSGSDVEEAVAAGLETLGLERDAVKIQVLDEGSRGLLGIGARPARVRLFVETVAAPECSRA